MSTVLQCSISPIIALVFLLLVQKFVPIHKENAQEKIFAHASQGTLELNAICTLAVEYLKIRLLYALVMELVMVQTIVDAMLTTMVHCASILFATELALQAGLLVVVTELA